MLTTDFTWKRWGAMLQENTPCSADGPGSLTCSTIKHIFDCDLLKSLRQKMHCKVEGRKMILRVICLNDLDSYISCWSLLLTKSVVFISSCSGNYSQNCKNVWAMRIHLSSQRDGFAVTQGWLANNKASCCDRLRRWPQLCKIWLETWLDGYEFRWHRWFCVFCSV